MDHVWIEYEKRVHPPQCVSFRIKFMLCECGAITATPIQRRKNRKQYNGSRNKWTRIQRGRGDNLLTA